MKEIETYQAIKRELSEIDSSHTLYGKLYSQYVKNMHRIYPNRDKKQNMDDFRRTLFYQRLAYSQQHTSYRWSESMEEPLPESLIRNPGIILTAHTYSYRNVVRYLAQNGLPLCLVVARRVYDRQSQEFEEIMRDIHGDDFSSKFRLVEAEDPTVLLKLRHAHSEGMYIIGYIDGNTGSAIEHSINNNLQLVPFGEGNLWVRTGLFRIAILLQCSVHSVWTGITEDYQSVYQFQHIQHVLTKENLESNIAKVYASLEMAINPDPAQWECFLYLEDFLCLDAIVK